MSKLIGIFEAFNGVNSTAELIKICETTMNDAKRAEKEFGETAELNAIYNASKHDRDLLKETYDRFKKEYDELIEKVRGDSEIIGELESTKKVPHDFEKAFEALKQELLSPKGYEKPEE